MYILNWDNMDLSRFKVITEVDLIRNDRYMRAYSKLLWHAFEEFKWSALNVEA